MKNKKRLIAWGISLGVLTVATVGLLFGLICKASVPDTLIRVFGCVELVAVGAFGFTTVRFMEKNRE